VTRGMALVSASERNSVALKPDAAGASSSSRPVSSTCLHATVRFRGGEEDSGG